MFNHKWINIILICLFDFDYANLCDGYIVQTTREYVLIVVSLRFTINILQ